MTTEPARIYRRVVFLQGDDGREVVDRLTRTEGVLVRGATDTTIGECITALAEGDDGWSGEITADPSGGARDHVTERDLDGILYRLTWNVDLGYVGLEEVLTPVRPADHVIFTVTYDPLLVSPEFMAEHLNELEGVEVVRIKDGA